MEESEVIIGHYYRHFKGNIYKVTGKAVHTETEETIVLYQELGNPLSAWARPIKMFCDMVGDVPRFEHLKEGVEGEEYLDHG